MTMANMRIRALALLRLCGFAAFVACAALTSSCSSDEDTIVVRLQSGPLATVAPDTHVDDPPLRFVLAGGLAAERSALPYARFANALTGALRRHVEIVRRRTYAELNELLRTGRAEAGILCPGAFAVGREEFGLRALLTATVDDRATHQALVVVRRDSGRKSLEELHGAVFAFSDPLSASGYQYVATTLLGRGTSAAAFFKRTIFTYSHDNTIQAVRDGIADGGSVHSLVWASMLSETPSLGEALAVVESSPDLPSNPVVVSPQAPASLAEQLSHALLDMPSSSAGRAVLMDLGISGFVKLPDAAYDSVVRSWRELGVIPAPPP